MKEGVKVGKFTLPAPPNMSGNGTGWGPQTINLKSNPLSSQNSQDTSLQNRYKPPDSLLNLFAKKNDPSSAIIFNFGTEKKFTAKSNPKEAFKSINFTIPKPTIVKKEEAPKREIQVVEEKTGEEEEEILFDEKAILYMYKTDDDGKGVFAEKGQGNIHINRGNGFYRITMRRCVLNQICLNSRIFEKMNPTLNKKGKKPLIQMMAQDLQDTNKLAMYRIVFQNEEIADKFFKTLQSSIEAVKSQK